MQSKKAGKVTGYKEGIMKRIEIGNFQTFEYHFPFNYENVNVVRNYHGGETHGMESNPINSYMPEPERRPSDYIEIEENKGIVSVEVIGSACTPPGFVMLSAEPMDDFRRQDEIPGLMPVRFRINNLWGMHLRVDQWYASNDVGPRCQDNVPPYEEIPQGFIDHMPKFARKKMKMDYRDMPIAGMSCALFSIPRSKSIKIMAGSEVLGWHDDHYPDDSHYSIRMIRVTVCDVIK